jgi:hypothetical protein
MPEGHVTTDGVPTVGVEQRVPVGELQPNNWNPNRMDEFMYQKELASIRSFGFVDPITVRLMPDGRFEILDGEHRWRAAQELGMKMIPVWNLGDVPDAVAKQLTIVLNETRGHADESKLSALLTDLMESESAVDLMETLPFDPERFRALTGADFDWQEFEELASQESEGSHWVERVFRMPIEAAEVLDQALAKVKTEGGGDMNDAQALEAIAADYLGG